MSQLYASTFGKWAHRGPGRLMLVAIVYFAKDRTRIPLNFRAESSAS